MPVEIMGLTPPSPAILLVVENERDARDAAEDRERDDAEAGRGLTLEASPATSQPPQQDLNVIIKGDRTDRSKRFVIRSSRSRLRVRLNVIGRRRQCHDRTSCGHRLARYHRRLPCEEDPGAKRVAEMERIDIRPTDHLRAHEDMDKAVKGLMSRLRRDHRRHAETRRSSAFAGPYRRLTS